MIDVADVISAIEYELKATPHYIELNVQNCQKIGNYWQVTVQQSNEWKRGAVTIDESLEGATAWWRISKTLTATADVLTVVPEESLISLRYPTGTPPQTGKIRLYLPRYLEALRDLWQTSWSSRCAKWLEDAETNNLSEPSKIVNHQKYLNFLRQRQIEAFKLPSWKVGFLHGPPGTGKTTTLGCLLAEYLIKFPQSRVLLLSTTNLAVDQALVSVDRALERDFDALADKTRRKCFRIGNHFIAGNYQKREHLLPVQDERLIKQLADLQANRPEPSDVRKYGVWKEEVEMVRAKIKRQSAEVLSSARLAAMTTTRAVFTFSEIQKNSPYDLIVFDESSQVAQAHALALTPLGKSCLFAGDPQQLAPIVRAEHNLAMTWIGKSIFDRQTKFGSESNIFLNEQSRMAEPICEIVSKTFYKKQLIVAEKELKNPQWNLERKLTPCSMVGERAVSVINITGAHTWSSRYGGNIRYNSAEKIKDLVVDLIKRVDQSNILVLTPFRAQRSLIKSFLRNADCKKVRVSTVHRAQGGECHTVIFDPVAGASEFLQTEDAKRLVNVALSRAQARLTVLLSSEDLHNETLKKIYYLVDGSSTKTANINNSTNDASGKLILNAEFPFCALEQVIQFKGGRGRVTEILDDGKKFRLMDFDTGEAKLFITEYIKRQFQNR